MMKHGMILFLAAWLAFFAPACALGQGFLMDQARTYTFGGSETDELEYLAVSADGRIVMTGSSYSSDGDLSGSPMRDSGDRCGWAMGVDAQGNKLWTFVTNVCDLEELRFPVFHADGSVTMVLEARYEDYVDDCMLIRLDRSGQVAHSAVLNSERLTQNVVSRVLSEGYEVFVNNVTTPVYHVFNWDGELLSTREAVPELPTEMETFELSNGAIVGIATKNLGEKYEPIWEGQVCLWDAQGNLLADVRLADMQLCDVIGTRDGFIVAAQKAGELDWRLYAFDQAGEVIGSCDVGTTNSGAFCVAELPDGSIVCVRNEHEDPADVHSDVDVYVTIIPRG